LGVVCQFGSWILSFLLGKSYATGGGDVNYRIPEPKYEGRCAGDRVYLMGDYYSNNLFRLGYEQFSNISNELVAEYNRFIENKKRLL
jgi:hypothetical protein